MSEEAGPSLEQTQQPPADDGVHFSQVPLLLFIRGLLAVSVLVSVIAGLHYYLGARLIDALDLPAWAAKLAWVALWSAFASMPLGFSARLLPRPFSTVLQWTGFLWMGAFGVLLSATAASDLILFVASLAAGPHPAWHHLQALAVLGVSGLALAWGFFVARGTPAVEKVTVEVPGLHPELDGLKIAQISDIHIGETLGREFLERIVETVNRLEADLVAVTGDLVDGSVRKLREEVAPLGRLKGRHGVYFVTGNHEYYSGADAWGHEVQRLGLTVLHNEHRVVERGAARLVVAGVPDLEGGRFSEAHRPDAAKAFAGAPDGATRILLAHQPRFARLAQGHDVKLMLSGHTHGGQIFPFMAFVLLQQPVIKGLKQLWGVPVYTSKGTGYWGPPFRVGPRSEVTELTLRKK